MEMTSRCHRNIWIYQKIIGSNKNFLIKNQIKDVSRVSTPDSVYEEKIFDQFREKLNNSFHFKNVEMETELPYVKSSFILDGQIYCYREKSLINHPYLYS